jgi:hypothetical protein
MTRRLLDTGRVFVTGEFQPAEAVPMIQAQDATLAWLPSVWPETWCFTLSEAWRPGCAWSPSIWARKPNASVARGLACCCRLVCRRLQSILLLAAAGLSDHR